MRPGIAQVARCMVYIAMMLTSAGRAEAVPSDERALGQQATPAGSAPPRLDPAWFLSGGAGCVRDNSTLIVLSSGFDVVFDKYSLTGPGGTGELSVPCTVAMRVPAIAGWEWSLDQLVIAGQVKVTSGGPFWFDIDSRYADLPPDPSARPTIFSAPTVGVASFTTKIGYKEVANYKKIWSGCGKARDYVIGITANVRGPNTTYAHFRRMAVEVVWRRCP